MSYNSFGRLFRLTTWGESHGDSIGCILDGVPPNLSLSESDIQPFLARRRPGQSEYTTQRQELDEVRILSGVFEGMTTGTPLSMMIDNVDRRSKDYGDIAESYRPSHADYVYDLKYGFRDYRGGGRSSARETAMRVAGGAVAYKLLVDMVSSKIKVRGALVELGGDSIERERWDWSEVSNNSFFCPDAVAVERWESLLKSVRKSGDSLGAIIEVHAEGVMGGLGAPIYGKLDSDLAGAMMGIPAVKGVEIGLGFGASRLRGSEHADEMEMGSTGGVEFLSNHAGGILGGISSGQDIVVRFAVKPTSSILHPVRSVTKSGRNTEVITKGRHDPCVGIRAVPIGEAMMALVLADHWLLHRAQCGS